MVPLVVAFYDQRGADARAGVASSRLDEDLIEVTAVDRGSVRHAIERDTTGQAEIAGADELAGEAQVAQCEPLSESLSRMGDVAMTGGEIIFGAPRGTQKFDQARTEQGSFPAGTAVMVEIGQVQTQLSSGRIE